MHEAKADMIALQRALTTTILTAHSTRTSTQYTWDCRFINDWGWGAGVWLT